MQGDILENCPVLIPKDDGVVDQGNDHISAVIEFHDVIIATQSCDLADQKIPFAIVCPLFELKAFSERAGSSVPAIANSLKKGHQPSFYLLDQCRSSECAAPFRVAELVRALPVRIPTLLALATASGPRLRMLPPYREHFSQAFGHLFARVALTTPLPDFKKIAV
jgi:hypothetical protein